MCASAHIFAYCPHCTPEFLGEHKLCQLTYVQDADCNLAVALARQATVHCTRRACVQKADALARSQWESADNMLERRVASAERLKKENAGIHRSVESAF